MPGWISDQEDFDLSHANLVSLSLKGKKESQPMFTLWYLIFFPPSKYKKHNRI